MAKASKSQKTARRNLLLYKAALILISTIILVWFMPRSKTSTFQYEVDKPWGYNQLIAEFQFPIYKSDAEMKSAKDSVAKSFQPYFNLDPKVRRNMQADIYNKTRKEWTGKNADSYIQHISALADTVCKRGILSVVDYNKLLEQGCTHIRVVNNNSAVSIPIAQVFSTRSAYKYIVEYDTTKYSRIVMQNFNINDILRPTLTLDEKKTKTELKELLDGLSGAVGMVQSGQQIIDRGEIVTSEKYKILQSFERETSKHQTTETIIPFSTIGQTVFVLFVLIVLISYLSLFRKDYFDNHQTGILLFGFPIVFCIIAFLMVSHHFLNVFVIPFCMVPIVIRVFMDSRTAFMFHASMIIIISLTLHYPYEFLMLQLLTGMIAIQTLRELSQRSQIIQTAALITLFYIIFYSSYELIVSNTYAKIDYSMYKYFIVNGILLIFTYPLLWLIEKSFGFVSDVTLVELSNINNPVLQRMSEIAPGTFQHSLMVSNLCSEVAKKVEARQQLVRTAALYHDIGKLERPVFFTENQSGVSPHKHLSSQKSAEVIIAHVANGLALADRHNLPKLIKNFIASHHGTSLTKYFYITYKNEHPDEEVDESLFRYPGPNPATKEEAILMMADAVEAASRSLQEYTEESISQLVDKIVDSQVQEGCFSECDITFRDIAIAKDVFKEKLKIVYHTRISYPELNKDNEK